MPSGGLRSLLRELQVASTPRARRFRYWLPGLDEVNLAWVVAGSFLHGEPFVLAIDVAPGLVLTLEFALRIRSWGRHWRVIFHPVQIADLVAIASLLAAPSPGRRSPSCACCAHAALHSVQTISTLRSDLPFFRRNEDAALAAVQLGVFLIIMSGVVLETQHNAAGPIRNYLDAPYFTVTSLTTTGYGDVTLADPVGRALSIVIMLAGVTLFLRLAQTPIRPRKVRFSCPTCRLLRHDPDAVHCKACGTLLNIPGEDF